MKTGNLYRVVNKFAIRKEAFSIGNGRHCIRIVVIDTRNGKHYVPYKRIASGIIAQLKYLCAAQAGIDYYAKCAQYNYYANMCRLLKFDTEYNYTIPPRHFAPQAFINK